MFFLDPETYSLEVLVYADGAKEDLAARGTTDTDFTVSAGVETAPVSLTLRPIASEGEGSLAFSLQYPAGVTGESFTLSRIAGGEEPLDLKTGGSASGTDPVTFAGKKTAIPAGYYLLRAEFRNSAGLSTGKSEVVHIYQNLEASASYAITADDFKYYRVSSAADSGPGSLRQALLDVPAGQTIQINLEPGSAIELASALPAIGKNLTIQGNGVTLTRAASWTAVGYDTRLLYITGSNAVITIRRVHFKDGLVRGSGGAIRNTGTLTLESCIFSGNRTTDGSGGAVYSRDNDLTIRGCTFYGNTAGSSGGAVYFYPRDSVKTLTLTGNLFYGDTATSSRPVVYNYITTPTTEPSPPPTTRWTHPLGPTAPSAAGPREPGTRPLRPYPSPAIPSIPQPSCPSALCRTSCPQARRRTSPPRTSTAMPEPAGHPARGPCSVALRNNREGEEGRKTEGKPPVSLSFFATNLWFERTRGSTPLRLNSSLKFRGFT